MSKKAYTTVHFSKTACPHVVEKLKHVDDINLSEASTSLGKSVDFMIRNIGIVYITEKEMNGKVKDFLPRILALIYEYKYISNPCNNPYTDDNDHTNKRFRFNKKMVYIHHHPDNTEKCLSLQLFCTDHEIPHVLVQNEDHVKKLICFLVKYVWESFITPICGSYLNGDWGKDNCLLNGSLKQLILKLPYVTEKNNEGVMKHFQCIGALINADKKNLRVAFSNKQTNFLYKFFR